MNETEEVKSKAGWVLISHETDEFYGQVQWRDKDGNMTDTKKAIQQWPHSGYVFCEAGLGKLKIVI